MMLSPDQVAAIEARVKETNPQALGWYGTNVKELLNDLTTLLADWRAQRRFTTAYLAHHGKMGGNMQTDREIQDALAALTPEPSR